jgi:hypothetical protein
MPLVRRPTPIQRWAANVHTWDGDTYELVDDSFQGLIDKLPARHKICRVHIYQMTDRWKLVD